ncbi:MULTISPECIES: divalent-cation tolerance protein CutA [unclassified Leptolyngbya]|uniref:divalent-cation tolerance protein CutA n=1 Tax=unclassified Leptolyngbya TaxID=2650499 RepID=UPI00168905F3|nr:MULTISPECIES: divalent-cation tolerance protein CutA [unclassified Leptolyngbya]MBD1913730.1 divalent-cation tolerance protein CutA [Leptolyngbya sp. FACHB-8]MBD2153235.1 divalent-cation tolerance protein CutA [Leptolyngbya sp. FACHB-16]
MDEGRYGLVLVTAGTEAEARAIAQALVSERLAACVNLFPVQSTYRWQGEVQQDAEWQLFIKTDLQRFAELEARICALHSYEVPEIIALPIQAGSALYMAWLAEQTTM